VAGADVGRRTLKKRARGAKKISGRKKNMPPPRLPRRALLPRGGAFFRNLPVKETLCGTAENTRTVSPPRRRRQKTPQMRRKSSRPGKAASPLKNIFSAVFVLTLPRYSLYFAKS
jgi:hypothetical protein